MFVGELVARIRSSHSYKKGKTKTTLQNKNDNARHELKFVNNIYYVVSYHK